MLTDEQELIVVTEADRILVSAFAGCGKTFTLVSYAKKRPKKSFLYLAFNTAIKNEATTKMPANVTVKTGHGLAFQKVGIYFKHKLINNLYPNSIISLISSKYKIADQSRYFFSLATIRTLNNFFQGSDREILKKHLPFDLLNISHSNNSEYHYKLIHFANTVWSIICNRNDNRVGMTHDAYLKLFQLKRPKLSYDYILFDECQDANPVIVDILSSQIAKIIFVGDEHQQIYAFRGAVNAIDLITTDVQLSLTSSFRFGSNVAHVANQLLSEFKDERRQLKGLGRADDLGQLPMNKQHALICRTNSSIFFSALASLKDGLKPFFVGGIEGYNFDIFVDGANLLNGTPPQSQLLKGFNSFEELEQTATDSGDFNLMSIVKAVDKFGEKITKLVNTLYKNQSFKIADADVILTTAHKSKGLEFPLVKLANDFCHLDEPIDDSNEINLWYVAATRAERQLQPNKKLNNFLKDQDKLQLES